jgi:hypothetical protein
MFPRSRSAAIDPILNRHQLVVSLFVGGRDPAVWKQLGTLGEVRPATVSLDRRDSMDEIGDWSAVLSGVQSQSTTCTAGEGPVTLRRANRG